MASDVTVHDPSSRIIRLEGDDDVSITRKENDVPAWGVVEFQVQFLWECRVLDLLQDGEIVAVEVDLTRS